MRLIKLLSIFQNLLLPLGVGIFIGMTVSTMWASLSSSKDTDNEAPHRIVDSSRKTKLEKGDAFLSLTIPTREDYDQPDIVVKSLQNLFKDMPPDKKKTYFVHTVKQSEIIKRVFHHASWTRVDFKEEARLVFAPRKNGTVPEIEVCMELLPWQRCSEVKIATVWEKQEEMSTCFRRYNKKLGKQSLLPNTFDLAKGEERQELMKNGGLDKRWQLWKNTTTQVLKPKELKALVSNKQSTGILQQYPSDVLTWDGRKLVIKMTWLVASFDPLIAFYMDGYASIGNRADFAKNTMVSWKELETYLNKQKGSKIGDPAQHVRNQIKASVAQLVDAIKDYNGFNKDLLFSEDAFKLHTASFVIDKNLDVWLTKSGNVFFLEEDYYFKLEMNHHIHYGMAMILEEIWDKQERGAAILPLENTGRWQLIYSGDWKYDYPGYERTISSPER